MKWLVFVIALSVDAAAPLRQWEKEGRSLFLEGEFKQAARAFEAALHAQPDRAELYFWLGKSYARLASVSSPLFAPNNARKAQKALENAVRLDPENRLYREEMFDFYLDSPEWFNGGLARAASLSERVDRGEHRVRESRKAHSGAGWHIQKAMLWTSGVVGAMLLMP